MSKEIVLLLIRATRGEVTRRLPSLTAWSFLQLMNTSQRQGHWILFLGNACAFNVSLGISARYLDVSSSVQY